MKKIMQSIVSVILALCVGYFLPITSFASFDIKNTNYIGVYKNPANSKSYISALESGCNVTAVYSDERSTYVTAKNAAGYFSYKRFYAEFSSYYITKSDGSGARKQSAQICFSGTVSMETGEKYIYTGGRYYRKK